jgi:hypothetical protein
VFYVVGVSSKQTAVSQISRKNQISVNEDFNKKNPSLVLCADRLPSAWFYEYLLNVMLKSFSVKSLCDFKR